MSTFVCDRCKIEKSSNPNSVGTGYGQDENGNKICYACCAVLDAEYMREHGKITLYLMKKDSGYTVSNWPSSLVIPVSYYTRKGKRTDVYFTFAGYKWHGFNVSDNNDLCHCKRLK